MAVVVHFSGAWQIFFNYVETWARETEASIELLPVDIVYRYKSLEEMAKRFGQSQSFWRENDDLENDENVRERDRVVFEYRSFSTFIFRDIVPCDDFGFKWSEFEHEGGVRVLREGGFGGAEMMKRADAAHVYVEGDPVEPVIVPDHALDDVGRWFELAKLAAVSTEMRAMISSGALARLKKLHTKVGKHNRRIDEWRYDRGALMAHSIKHASVYASVSVTDAESDADSVDFEHEVPLYDGDFTFAFVHERSFHDADVRGCDLQNARGFNTKWHDMGIEYEAGHRKGYEDVVLFDDENVAKRPDATVVYVRKLGHMLKQVMVEYWTNHTVSEADVLTMLDAAPWSAQ